MAEAIEFAQEELAPRGEENREYLQELESTMALLAFDPGATSPVSGLLRPAQRQKIASELNAAILASQCQERQPKLPALLQMLSWAQGQLAEKLSFPRIHNYLTAELEEPGTSSA